MVLNQEQERFAQTLQKLERKRLSDAFGTPHGNEPPRAERADRADHAERASDSKGEREQHPEPNTRSDCSPAANAAPNTAAAAASNSTADDTPHPSQEQ